MPKLWSETIQTHRREVRDAVLDAAAGLVAERGLRSVTMAQVAEQAGIGRATLYKYFPDLDAILRAWHDRQAAGHLRQLTEIRDATGDPDQRLAAVLEAYALIVHRARRSHDPEFVALLHGDEQVADAQHQLHELIRDLLSAATQVRGDTPPDELAAYCRHALGAAAVLPSRAAVLRLVGVVLDGLTPRSGPPAPAPAVGTTPRPARRGRSPRP